jgi:hypothetical protein
MKKSTAIRIAVASLAGALIAPVTAQAATGTPISVKRGTEGTARAAQATTYCPFQVNFTYSKAAYSWINVDSSVVCSGPDPVIVSLRASITGFPAGSTGGNYCVAGNGCLSKATWNFPPNGSYLGGAQIALVTLPDFEWVTGPNSCRGYGGNILLCTPLGGGVVFP